MPLLLLARPPVWVVGLRETRRAESQTTTARSVIIGLAVF